MKEKGFLATTLGEVGVVERQFLTRAEIQTVASLVAAGIARIGDQAITPPKVEAFDASPHRSIYHDQTLRLDVDMGGFVLPLWADDLDTHPNGRADPSQLAKAAVARISQASRGRAAIVERLTRARAAAQEAAERIGAEVGKIRLGRSQISRSMAVRDRLLEVDIELLDDALQPRTTTIEGSGGRAFRSTIALFARRQRRRLSSLARRPAGAVLQIDAIAEAAIRFSGREVGDVAAQVMESLDQQNWMLLSGTMFSDHIGVRLQHGVLVCDASIPGLGVLGTNLLRVEHAFPETIRDALKGRALAAVATHPLLVSDATIVKVSSSGKITELAFRSPTRAVTAGEIATGGIPGAA